MSKIVNKYRMFCITENDYIYKWDNTLPSHCYNNTSHILDTSTITIIDTISTNEMKISQELVPTGGNYRTEAKEFVLDGSAIQTFDISWPYRVSMLTITILSGDDNGDDILNTYIAPNTVIGIITQNISENDTIINVNQTVVDNINLGYRVYINNIFIGECINIDKTALTITIDTPSIINAVIGNYCTITINNIKNFLLKKNATYELGRKTIGGSSIPANTIVRINYENKSQTTKELYVQWEYLY